MKPRALSILPKEFDPLKEKFFAKIVKDDAGCWNWRGAVPPAYGQFRLGGISAPAHRVSFAVHVGKIPRGILVCHKCDNPACVNPEHLFLGTHTDNMRDKVAKKRHWKGENWKPRKRRPNAKMSMALRLAPKTARAIHRMAREQDRSVSFIVNQIIAESITPIDERLAKEPAKK